MANSPIFFSSFPYILRASAGTHDKFLISSYPDTKSTKDQGKAVFSNLVVEPIHL